MTILLLGTQLELGHYRTEFLQCHGIRVIFPENKNSAISAIRAGGFDSAVLSYTLNDEIARELVALIEQSCPDCPLVAITNKRWNGLEFKADEMILDTDPPQSLIDALIRVEKRLRNKQSEQLRRIK